MNNSTMGSSGIHAQNSASSMRYIETLHAEPSKVVLFRSATQLAIQNALIEEMTHGRGSTAILAGQGLYNNQDDFTIFHPNNAKGLNTIIGLSKDDSSFIKYGPCGLTYEIERNFLKKIFTLIEEKPLLMYVD